MSMDLFLWKAPVIDDVEKARDLVDRFLEQEDKGAFEPSPDVARALEAIRRRYPDDPNGGAEDSAPWSSWPIPDSDRLIELNIRWSVDGKVLDDIVAIGAEHDLVIYDPQGPDVCRAQDALESQPDEKASAKDFFNVMLLFLPIAGATLAAWWFIPWGWLRWPLVAVGLFFTISAGIVVYATIASAMGWMGAEPKTS